MRFISSLVIGTALAASLTAIVSPAFAADYQPPLLGPAEDPFMMEEVVTTVSTSHWYLRGDIAVSLDEFPHSREIEFYGFEEDSNFGTIGASLAVGYQISDLFRTEVEFAYHDLGEASGSVDDVPCLVDGAFDCDYSARADASNAALLLNAYADLGTIAGFTPYVGAGVGAALVSTDVDVSSTCSDPDLTDAIDCDPDDTTEIGYSADEVAVAMQVGAGVSYQIADRFAVDLGYRYFRVFGHDKIYVDDDFDWGMDDDLHEFRVGFRYGFF